MCVIKINSITSKKKYFIFVTHARVLHPFVYEYMWKNVCLSASVSFFHNFYFILFCLLFPSNIIARPIYIISHVYGKKKNHLIINIYQQYIVVAINIIISSLWRSLSLLLLISLLHFEHLQVVLIWFIVKKMLCFSIFQRLYCLLPHFYTHTSIYTLTYVCTYS